MNSEFTAVEQAAINKATEIRHLNDFRVKTSKYQALNKLVKPNQIVFAGDSITEGYPTSELIKLDKIIYNRGIGAIRSDYLLEHIETLILELKPVKVFILIGTNDLAYAKAPKRIVENIKNICLKIEEKFPQTKIYLLSVYPVSNTEECRFAVGLRTNKDISEINNLLEDFCKGSNNKTYLNLFDSLISDNSLNPKYTYDGLHLSVEGYLKVTEKLIPYLK